MTADLVVDKEIHGFTTKGFLSDEIKEEGVFNVDIIFDVGAMRSEGSMARKNRVTVGPCILHKHTQPIIATPSNSFKKSYFFPFD
ncbi:hypothetical protein [Janthinobacterium sp. B9-8]|uniref:hypothetical protein n=1 Tax=Janthinobacterium sp. B9-8 TaxID=1236179 RepID=UPI00061CF4BD|nr:hypothetical protein [Janthinobacterium sp. B9-8]AMC34691.1 hypothetical protein VN23_08765 [Janthinobacterium sp. B9-8]